MKKASPSEQPDLRVRYKDLEKKARQAVGSAKRIFFSKIKDDRRKLWSVFSKILNRKQIESSPTDADPNDMNSHFVSMGQHGKPHDPPEEPSLAETPGADNVFVFQTVGTAEVARYLREITQKRKSTGPNGIPHQLLKKIIPLIDQPITNLINNCLINGVFPDVFKTATVIPIPK